MSYMIQFRNHGPLPEGAQTPPYILFGVNGQSISQYLPSRIPRALVFHFIPKLKIWELPDMTNQSLQAARASLTEPHVGVNILADIEVKGLKWIICRIMQLGGLPQPKENFLVYPGLFTSLSIRKAWLALDLPPAGIEALGMQDLARLWFGQTISPSEMEILWESYPANSVQITSMGDSYLRGISSGHYTNQEIARVCAWYQEAEDREEFFKELENKPPNHIPVVNTSHDNIVARKRHTRKRPILDGSVSTPMAESSHGGKEAEGAGEGQSKKP